MGKMVADAAIDAMLANIALADRIDVVSDTSTPTDLTNTLAHGSLTPGDGNGDYTIADGTSSGRKLTVAQQADLSIDGSGDAKHIVLSLSGTIKLVTTCTTQTLTSGGTVTVPAFVDEVADPS